MRRLLDAGNGLVISSSFFACDNLLSHEANTFLSVTTCCHTKQTRLWTGDMPIVHAFVVVSTVKKVAGCSHSPLLSLH